MTEITDFNPFELSIGKRPLMSTVERILGLVPLADIYRRRPQNLNAQDFLGYTLDALRSEVTVVERGDLDSVPRQGPLLIIANHPLGGLEGVAIARLLLSLRPDVKVLANQVLCRIPELQDVFIGVDILSGGRERSNATAIRQAGRHLKDGGALLIFPAGVVASLSPLTRRIEEKPWHRLVGQLALKYQANCLPIHVAGRNSRLFYLLGLIHPRLRTVCLARELANKQGQPVTLTVGEVITADEYIVAGDGDAVARYLRMNTEILGVRHRSDQQRPQATESASIAELTDIAENISDIEDCRLFSKGDFSVFCAPFGRLPEVIHAIGSAREMTFRAAGEGTGKSEDIDAFDPHYLHLFLWDHVRQRIAGGYRIGKTDEIIARHGLNGLYSRSLYRFDEQFIRDLGPALEMGRSFVQPDYQRRPEVLDLLWRGIGAYVVRNMNYSVLFGAVSISREYSTLARQLISKCVLTNFRAEQKYLNEVSPLTPVRSDEVTWNNEMWKMLSNIKVLNKLIGRCDPGKTIPVLLRHYLSLNGRFVCFSLNTGFNDSLDGLMMVDLRTMPAKYLNRYLGKTGADCFVRYWGKPC